MLFFETSNSTVSFRNRWKPRRSTCLHCTVSFGNELKHYYTVPVSIVEEVTEREQNSRFELEPIQLSDLADRFGHYLQRVPVPDPPPEAD